MCIFINMNRVAVVYHLLKITCSSVLMIRQSTNYSTTSDESQRLAEHRAQSGRYYFISTVTGVAAGAEAWAAMEVEGREPHTMYTVRARTSAKDITEKAVVTAKRL